MAWELNKVYPHNDFNTLLCDAFINYLMTNSSYQSLWCTYGDLCLFRLFEDAASKLNLVGLVGFLHQLRKASQSQLFNSVTETGDYSLAMPGNSPSPHMKPSHWSEFCIGFL